MNSSVTRPRSLKEGAFSAWNSSSIQPTPAPRMMRPPESTSMVASIFAVTTGFRYGMMRTLVPMRMRLVSAARCAMSGSGSR